MALHHGQFAPGKEKDMTREALHHGHFAQGKGKDLNHELPNQLQRECINLNGWTQFFHPSQLP